MCPAMGKVANGGNSGRRAKRMLLDWFSAAEVAGRQKVNGVKVNGVRVVDLDT